MRRTLWFRTVTLGLPNQEGKGGAAVPLSNQERRKFDPPGRALRSEARLEGRGGGPLCWRVPCWRGCSSEPQGQAFRAERVRLVGVCLLDVTGKSEPQGRALGAKARSRSLPWWRGGSPLWWRKSGGLEIRLEGRRHWLRWAPKTVTSRRRRRDERDCAHQLRVRLSHGTASS